jgi:hypothetical protein
MAMYIARVEQEIETGIRVHREMPGATENQKAEAISRSFKKSTRSFRSLLTMCYLLPVAIEEH